MSAFQSISGPRRASALTVERHVPATPMDPSSVVQRQLEAYNAHDVEALLRVYADDAEMYEHPAKLVARGSSGLRERFAARFRERNLRARLIHRIIAGETVIDHEKVTRTFPEGEGEMDLVMIYEVRDGRIQKAWSIAGARTIFSK